MSTTTRCLRCQAVCRTGTPDPKARAIVQATTQGYCASCMATRFFLGVEVLRELIEGSPARGTLVAARPGLGPEILLNGKWREKTLRPLMQTLLSATQMPESAIDWIKVVGNWGLPWTASDEPRDLFQ